MNEPPYNYEQQEAQDLADFAEFKKQLYEEVNSLKLDDTPEVKAEIHKVLLTQECNFLIEQAKARKRLRNGNTQGGPQGGTQGGPQISKRDKKREQITLRLRTREEVEERLRQLRRKRIDDNQDKQGG